MGTLSTKLFTEGWKGPDGKPVSKAEIHRLLGDCFYCGEFNWNKKHYKDAKHPSLISTELFYRVQERMNRKLNGKYRKHDFFFHNIKCGECGRSVVGEIQKGYTYYHCTRFKTNCSQRKYISEVDLEKEVVTLFDRLEIKNERLADWIRKALKESHADESVYHNNALAELNRQYTLYQKRLDAIYDDKLDQKITEETYNKKFKEFTEAQEKIVESLERHRKANISYLELGINIFELSQKGKEIYQTKAKPEEKRALMNFVFSNLLLKDKKLHSTYTNAFQLIAEKASSCAWRRGRDSNSR